MAKIQATPARQAEPARRANQQQRFAPQLVDQGHAHDGEHEIGGADGDGLLVAGDVAEPRRRKNAVQVIENRVDAGQLIKRADGDGQKQRVAIFPSENGLVR